MNGLAHENAAIDLARKDLADEQERRGERIDHHGRRYEPHSPEWQAEDDRLRELADTARYLDDQLGTLTYQLLRLRETAVAMGAADVVAGVQVWIDYYMPLKKAAAVERERSYIAVGNFILTGEKQ
jgi:uncharacterized membrane protein YccC